MNAPPPPLSLRTALWSWLEIGLLSFGGPTAQIAVMHRVIVERHGWLDDAAFLRGLNFCMLLPGPEAHQLVTWLGYRLHGFFGGLLAGLLFVLPGAGVMSLLSLAYAAWQTTPIVASVMFGMKSAVIALVALALHRLAGRILHRPALIVIAVAAFLAMWCGVPYPFVMLVSAIIGGALKSPHKNGSPFPPADGSMAARVDSPGSVPTHWLRHALRVLVPGVMIWWAPVGLAAVLLGRDHILVEEGLFFGQLAVLSFGGAYSVLSWLQQAAVTDLGWLTTTQMADGLGLAETTPGPLILVTQFVGTLAAWKHPEPFSPAVAGFLGGAMAVWTTFTPSFLWIFLAGSAIDRIQPASLVSRGLQGVSAAVVGVIGVLAVQLARQTLLKSAASFGIPGVLQITSAIIVDLRSVVLVLAAGVAFYRFPHRMGWILAACALIGWAVVRVTGGV